MDVRNWIQNVQTDKQTEIIDSLGTSDCRIIREEH